MVNASTDNVKEGCLKMRAFALSLYTLVATLVTFFNTMNLTSQKEYINMLINKKCLKMKSINMMCTNI